jgi:hypothetical protein
MFVNHAIVDSMPEIILLKEQRVLVNASAMLVMVSQEPLHPPFADRVTTTSMAHLDLASVALVQHSPPVLVLAVLNATVTVDMLKVSMLTAFKLATESFTIGKQANMAHALEPVERVMPVVEVTKLDRSTVSTTRQGISSPSTSAKLRALIHQDRVTGLALPCLLVLRPHHTSSLHW